MLVDALNNFGKAEGFEHILSAIEHPESSIELVCFLVDMLSNATHLYHKSFIDNYFERLVNSVR
jgi:hypothetical protein